MHPELLMAARRADYVVLGVDRSSVLLPSSSADADAGTWILPPGGTTFQGQGESARERGPVTRMGWRTKTRAHRVFPWARLSRARCFPESDTFRATWHMFQNGQRTKNLTKLLTFIRQIASLNLKNFGTPDELRDSCSRYPLPTPATSFSSSTPATP